MRVNVQAASQPVKQEENESKTTWYGEANGSDPTAAQLLPKRLQIQLGAVGRISLSPEVHPGPDVHWSEERLEGLLAPSGRMRAAPRVDRTDGRTQ